MQYMVTSQDRPQKSPLYSINRCLNSFILFNNGSFSGQVTLTELMANREEEVNTTEVSKQFAAFENFSKKTLVLSYNSRIHRFLTLIVKKTFLK